MVYGKEFFKNRDYTLTVLKLVETVKEEIRVWRGARMYGSPVLSCTTCTCCQGDL